MPFEPENLFTGSDVFRPDPSLGLGSQGVQPGIGLAPKPQEGLQNMNLLQKIGLVAQAFGAGAKGQPLLINQVKEQQLLERKQRREELAQRLDTATNLSKLAAPLRGEKRNKFIEASIEQVAGDDAEYAGFLRSTLDRPDLLTSLPAFAQSDPVFKQMIESGDPKVINDYLKSDAGRHRWNQVSLPQYARAFQEKVPGMVEWHQKNNREEYEKIISDRKVTMTELRRLHDALPLNLQAGPEVIASVMADENQQVLQGVMGDQVKIVTDKKPSALEERTELLMESFPPEQRTPQNREIASGIVSGRYEVSINPQNGERLVIDVTTGQPIGGDVPKIDPENIEPFLPEGIDASQIAGFKGFFLNTINTISDAIGTGLTTPEAEDAKQALDDLQVLTMSLLQAEVPGRPSNFLLQRLERLTVTPASILHGEERARRRLAQTRRLINQEIKRIDQEMQKPLRPVQLQSLRINQGQLKGLEKAYERVIEGFGGGTPKAELDKPIVEMSLDDIDKIDFETLDDEQFKAISKRLNELGVQ